MIEIPLIIIKGSFESRKRNYKCNICKEVIDRLFQFEDHWLGHLISRGGTLGNDSGDGGQPDASGGGGRNGSAAKEHVASMSGSNGSGRGNQSAEGGTGNYYQTRGDIVLRSDAVNDGAVAPNIVATASKINEEDHADMVPAFTGREVPGGSGFIQNILDASSGYTTAQKKDKCSKKFQDYRFSIRNQTPTQNLKGSSAASINLSTIDLRGFTKIVDVQETVLEESIRAEADTEEGDVAEGEILLGEEELQEDQDDGENSDGGNDALSDSENSDDEQVKRLIEVASNLQEMVKETLSENRSNTSDQTTTSAVTSASSRKNAHVKCLVCKKMFTHPKFLKLHMEVHEKPGTEKSTQVLCPVCKARFTHPKYLKLHMEVHDNSDTEALTCHICGRTFEKKFNLKKHITAHENDKEGRIWVPCPDCPRKFSDVGHLKIHAKRIHDKSMPFTLDQRTCEVCDKVFQNLDCVRAHRFRCHPVEFPSNRKRKPEPDENTSAAKQLKLQSEPTTCSICSKSFASADMLAGHIRKDHRDGVAGVCPRCDKIFLHGHLLSKHQISHEVAENNSEVWDMEKEDRTCLSCRIEFQNIEELGRHECKVKPKECPFCKRRISRPFGMVEHMRRHAQAEKKYICSICNVWQTPKHNMYVKHMAAHSSHPKPFQCPICKHRATTFFNHKNHMRCHDARYEFICYVCGVSISNPTNVRGHMKQKHNIHNVKKPFECDKCDRKCLTIGGLEEHKKQHGNKGDIQCPLCTDTFSNTRKWRLHRSQVHYGNFFKCDECGKEYPTERELTVHLEMHDRAKAFYECEICHVHYADLTQYTKHWYQHKIQICKCARCFANMSKVAFEDHKGKHLQIDTRVNKQCRLCGQILETIEDVYRHCIEHHEMNEALAVIIPCPNPAENSYRCDYNPCNRTCPVCSELFRVEEEWSMHMESHEFSRENPVKCMSCTGIFHAKDRFMRHVNNCVRSKRKAMQWGVNVSSEAGQFSTSMVVPNLRTAKYNLRSVDKQPQQLGEARQQLHQQQAVGEEVPIVKIIENDSAASTGNDITEVPTAETVAETEAEIKERPKGVVVEDVQNSNESAYPKDNPAERPIMCVLCCHFFETIDGLLYHLLIYCEEINHLKCWRCYSNFYTEEKLKPHVKKLKDECSVVDSSLLELRASLFSCQQCDKYFISESLSLLHNAQYHEIGNYQCHKCPQEFMYRYELEKHVFDQHAVDEGATNVCVMCCESFECLYDLQQHMGVHKLATVEL